jgi:hypothetical protein
MRNKVSSFRLLLVVVMLALAAFPSASVSANHSWNNYHWARTSNPFTIKLGDNVSGAWDNMLRTASTDWSKSNVLDTTVVAGGTTAKRCQPTSGRVEVCNYDYGGQQWLGVAQIWLSGGHIVQGTVKNNDHWFGNSTYRYNNTAEMQHVICQEIGHTFGLGHTSEDGSSQNTCMDYYHNTSNSDTTSTHPNQHDYDQLASIYSHLDGTTTIGSSATNLPRELAGEFGEPNAWGKLISSTKDGGASTYVRDFGGGNMIVTFVIWANE